MDSPIHAPSFMLDEEFDLGAIALFNSDVQGLEDPDHNAKLTEFNDAQASFRTNMPEDTLNTDFSKSSHLQHATDESILTSCAPSEPLSAPTQEFMRTRSGRQVGRVDPQINSVAPQRPSRVNKSVTVKPKRGKKLNPHRGKVPQIYQPLSILTKDMSTPLKDIGAWVTRSREVRQAEVNRRNGYVTRPMNSFMLYRSCYADRTKQWCLQNNHQVVSTVSGESWPLEPEHVRKQFEDWAKTERMNHQAAHPDYKFAPSKPLTNKRARTADSDDEADGTYQEPRKAPRRRRHREPVETAVLPPTAGFTSHPYFYDQPTLHENDYPSTWSVSTYAMDNMAAYAPIDHSVSSPGTIPPQTATFDMNGVNNFQENILSQNFGNYEPQTIGQYSDGLFQDMLNDGSTQHRDFAYPLPSAQSGYIPFQPQQEQYARLQARRNGLASAKANAQRQLLAQQRYLQAAMQPQSAIDPALRYAMPIDPNLSNLSGEFDPGFVTSLEDGYPQQ